MNPEDLIVALESHLKTWAVPQNARVSLAGDPAHVLDLLLDGPRHWRIILGWGGEESVNEYDYSGIVTHTVEVYTAFHMGLSSNPGEALLVSRDHRDSLIKIHSQVVQRVREHVFPDNQQSARIWNYRGSDPVVLPSGYPTASYRARFRLEAALPVINP